MKQLKYIFLFIIAPFVIAGCGGKSSQKADDVSQDTIAVVETVPDSTIYGVVGDGTAMHRRADTATIRRPSREKSKATAK